MAYRGAVIEQQWTAEEKLLYGEIRIKAAGLCEEGIISRYPHIPIGWLQEAKKRWGLLKTITGGFECRIASIFRETNRIMSGVLIMYRMKKRLTCFLLPESSVCFGMISNEKTARLYPAARNGFDLDKFKFY